MNFVLLRKALNYISFIDFVFLFRFIKVISIVNKIKRLSETIKKSQFIGPRAVTIIIIDKYHIFMIRSHTHTKGKRKSKCAYGIQSNKNRHHSAATVKKKDEA